MEHYTYAHCKPDGSIFYIGKGSGDRAYRTNHRNRYWQHIVAKHGTYTVNILAKWKTHEEALSHEVLLISCFKDMGRKLANLTEGGEGNSGYKPTSETLAKMSASMKGKPSWAKGKKLKPHTEETKQKMSIARKGKSISEQHRINIGLSKKGKATIQKGSKLSEAHANKLREVLVRARAKIKNQIGVPVKQIECTVCRKIGGLGAMRRWHFEKCKGLR